MDYGALSANIISIVLTVFGPILASLAAWAMVKLIRKLHIDASIIQDQQVFDAVAKGASYAEEYARKNKGTTGNQKLDIAFDFTSQILETKAVQEYGVAPLRKLIEATVNEKRSETSVVTSASVTTTQAN